MNQMCFVRIQTHDVMHVWQTKYVLRRVEAPELAGEVPHLDEVCVACNAKCLLQHLLIATYNKLLAVLIGTERLLCTDFNLNKIDVGSDLRAILEYELLSVVLVFLTCNHLLAEVRLNDEDFLVDEFLHLFDRHFLPLVLIELIFLFFAMGLTVLLVLFVRMLVQVMLRMVAVDAFLIALAHATALRLVLIALT
jgi:hypothetical protein